MPLIRKQIKVIDKILHYYLRKKQRLHLLKKIDRPTFIHTSASFNFHKNISIGKYCRIGRECHIDGEAGVEIGEGSIFAPRVVILTSSHNYNQTNFLPYDQHDKKEPVIIGRGCWIGWGAFILPGVTIGNGAIVAMGAVVTKSVEAGAIVGGNPAKNIGIRENADFVASAVEEQKYYLKAQVENQLFREGRKIKVPKNMLR